MDTPWEVYIMEAFHKSVSPSSEIFRVFLLHKLTFIIVPPSAITSNNTGGGIHFDATPDVFDVDV